MDFQGSTGLPSGSGLPGNPSSYPKPSSYLILEPASEQTDALGAPVEIESERDRLAARKHYLGATEMSTLPFPWGPWT